MAKKHELKVKSIKPETNNSISIGIDIPAHLRDEFDYEPGQYLTIEVDFEDGFERRAYSISSSSLFDDELTITVKRLEGGKVSSYLLDNLAEGVPIKVFSPEGKFVPNLNEKNTKDYLFIAAGSGITPVISIIKSILSFEKESKATLIYGNRDEDNIIFKNLLDELEERFQGKLKVAHTLSNPKKDWKGLKGRINESLIEKSLSEMGQDSRPCSFFLCGPSALMDMSEQVLISKGYSENQINREYFIKEKEESNPSAIISDQTALTVILDNERHQISLSRDSTVLETAIDAGLDAPYSCKIAACCTCRAKVLEGSVKMEDDEILTDDEKTEGYILTCQAYATSNELVISYDDA